VKEALALGLALVLGLGVASFAQTFNGSWNTAITIVPSPLTPAINTELIVTYAVNGWSLSSDTSLTQAGWSAQVFSAKGVLGAFTLGSTLTFSPATLTFSSWSTTGGLSLVGTTFDGTLASTFTLTPDNTDLKIVSRGTAGGLDIDVTVTFGAPLGSLCDFGWTGATIGIGFPFCCTDVTSTIAYDCTGFRYVTLAVAGLALPGIAWATLDALLTFTIDQKDLRVTPRFDFGALACFDIYLTNPATLFGDVSAVGLGIACEIGGVEFSGISYWGTGTKPGLLQDTPYWEAYQITTTDDGCCGPMDFDVTVYFLEGGTQLFDVAAIEANTSIRISSQFMFSTGISVDLEAAPATFSEWTLGFVVTW
jgi:hypothetical protein